MYYKKIILQKLIKLRPNLDYEIAIMTTIPEFIA